MTDWSRVAPASPVREVEAQRKRVLELRDQVPQRRAQREQAAARVVELEKQDRETMAAAMARGEDAAPDVEAVERARADSAGATRMLEALGLAIEAAEQQLHELVLKHRPKWAERAERDVVETRIEARQTLAAFRTALERHRQAQVVDAWLREGSGLDRGQGTRAAVLGPAGESASLMANKQAVDLSVVFGWLDEALAEPAPSAPQLIEPLQPIAR